MSEIESLAQSLLMRILLHDALLNGYRLAHHALQLYEVGIMKTEAYKLCPHPLVIDKTVLEHFGIAGAKVWHIESVEEKRADDNKACVSKHTNLVLQSIEVDTCLAANRRVNHCEERCGDVDEVDAALEGGSSESSKIRHHASTQIDKQRMAGGSTLAERVPDESQ